MYLGQCPPCDFDVDKCGYVDEDNDNFDWSRQKGATSSLNTGPSNDHTSGTSRGMTSCDDCVTSFETSCFIGYYMYVETSPTGRQVGDVAILRSPKYNASSSACNACMLEFWYHMFGTAIGTLDVSARVVAQRSDMTFSHVSGICGADV